jgi:predicted phage tail component-like protein
MINFNGFDLAALGTINQIKRNILPSMFISTRKIAGTVGIQFLKKEYDARRIMVTMTLKADKLEDRADQLAEVLETTNEVPIIIGDQPDRTYYGLLETEINKDDLVENLGRVTFTFLCTDPYKYGPEETANISGAGSINITGKEAAPDITINIQEAAQDLIITNDNGPEELRIIWNFIAGDTLQIDSKKKKVFINGILQMTAIDLTKAEFIYLKKGTNNLTFSVLSQATIKYRQGWL